MIHILFDTQELVGVWPIVMVTANTLQVGHTHQVTTHITCIQPLSLPYSS